MWMGHAIPKLAEITEAWGAPLHWTCSGKDAEIVIRPSDTVVWVLVLDSAGSISLENRVQNVCTAYLAVPLTDLRHPCDIERHKASA